ncbi:uncharacterized protein LOC110982278 [Acanthaster planci]|uniref:Uncharacterized protein LOC110982278 n=1 Tax=Acanthaster planci TaxID=133434 RepID=A0A8B7YUW4_ACAPL|nr:uncharacterized protein LOC110982278 [Acanthaster planci]
MARLKLAAIILCLIIAKSEGLWKDGGDDRTYGNMGYYTKNMTCDDDGSTCEQCFVARARGKIFLHTVEYTANPYTLQLTQLEGDDEWRLNFAQEDASESFRLCTATDYRGRELGTEQHLSVCLENFSTGYVAPAGCTKPVALVTLADRFSNLRMSGQQVMYCAS